MLNFTSTGAGTTGASDLAVGSANVDLTGKVYQKAIGQVNGTTVDFGIVHVGESVTDKNLSVSNIAPAVALNDTMAGSLNGVSGPFGAVGSLTGLACRPDRHHEPGGRPRHQRRRCVQRCRDGELREP